MIGRIRGTLLEKNPPEILVDVHGVGYEINVPMSTFYNLPDVGQEVTLLTHFIVREDAQLLYGFGTAKERAAFRQLIKISGIGARTALAVLSGMTVDALAQAVSKQESALLTRVPGIGTGGPGVFGSRGHCRGQEALARRQCFRRHPRSPKIHGTLIFKR